MTQAPLLTEPSTDQRLVYIEFEPTGSMTQEREGEASAQADESYCFGASKPIPDLVIEVVFTSGGPNKLQRYQASGGDKGSRGIAV